MNSRIGLESSAPKFRVRYAKTGKAQYISHLDLMATMQRALIRAGVRLKYSEGFNPHPYISVALPLSVGTESECELMDVAIQSGGIPDSINSYLPEGMEVLSVYKPQFNFNSIKWIEIACRLFYNDIAPGNILEKLKTHIAADSIIISKKTKRGVNDIDVAPHLRDVRVSFSSDNTVRIKAKISAVQPTISYNDIIRIVCSCPESPPPNFIKMKRIEMYDAFMVSFK